MNRRFTTLIGVRLARRVACVAAVIATMAATTGAGATETGSPGRLLLILSPTGSDLSALYSVNPDGRGLRRIASVTRFPGRDADHDCVDDATQRGICAGITDARWSPDGKRVAFATFVRECDEPCRRSGLYVADANGRSRRRLAMGFVTHFDWAPDGRRIAFVREDSPERRIYVVSGSSARPRTITAAGGPAWAPNGRRIAFVRGHGRGDEIWVAGPDGRGKRRVAKAAPDEGVYDPPDWSANSRWIAYVAQFTDGDVHVVRVDGKQNANLTPSHDADGIVRWAPVGGAIAYTVVRSCGMSGPSDPCTSRQVAVQSATGSPPELIDDVEFADHFGFVWSPDGRTIAFSRYLYPSANNGIWRKTLGRPGLTRVLAGDNWQVVDWERKY